MIVNRLRATCPKAMPTLAQQLSDRELQVFQMIGDGYATHEIADRLHISMKTVASHRENIKKKLNLKTIEELSRFAIHWQRHGGSGSREGADLSMPDPAPKAARSAKSPAKLKPTG
jgi:DNA-binding CsgD family transcriptional regulator